MLKIRNLSVGFRRYSGFLRQAETIRLCDISLEVMPGEILAVIGSSGAGKSLLALAIMGLLPANAFVRGEIEFYDQSLTGTYPNGIRGREIALIPQQISHLDPLARVGAQIHWAATRSGARPNVLGQLQRFGLSQDTRHLYPNQLSGGMARRVLMATASTSTPKLLIADETTANLDEHNQNNILRQIRSYANQGTGVLLITHDLRACLPYSDRVLVLDDGRMRGFDASHNFKDDGSALSSDYARALWQSLPENWQNQHA